MRATYKYIVPMTIAFLLILAAYLSKTAGWGADSPAQAKRNEPPQTVPVVAVGLVEAVDDVEARRYTGQITPINSVDLPARVSGEILAVSFTEGEQVKAGDLLFRIDPVRYDAAVKKARASVAECKAKVAYALLTYERSRGLYEQNAASKDTVDSAQSDYDAAQAALLAAEAELITARDDLKNTRVTAPIDGKIGVSAFSAGNYVTPSSGVLAAIVDTRTLRVRFSISNRDYLSLFRDEETLKEKAAVMLRLADDTLYDRTGSVDLIDNHADARSDTVTIYARFDNPDGILIPDGTVTVLLSKVNGGSIPAIAPSAIMYDATSPYVYVVDGSGRVERRNVELGVSASLVQNIKAGVAPGEKIVIDGMHKTSPGRRVEPQLRNWLPEKGTEGAALAALGRRG